MSSGVGSLSTKAQKLEEMSMRLDEMVMFGGDGVWEENKGPINIIARVSNPAFAKMTST